MSKKMSKLAVACKNNCVYAAVLENNKIVASWKRETASALESREAYSDALRMLVGDKKIKNAAICTTIEDMKCPPPQVVDAFKLSDQDFIFNLPYNFSNYIHKGSEEDYVFDYQTLPERNGKASALCIAAPRVELEILIDMMDDAGLDVERVVPESVAYGDILAHADRDNKRSVIVEVWEKSISVLIFNGRVKVASWMDQDGLGDLDLSLQDEGHKLFSETVSSEQAEFLEECEPVFNRIIPKICSALSDYEFNDYIAQDTPVFVTGVGACIPEFMDELQKASGHTVASIGDLVEGEINSVNVAMMGPAIGSALVLNK